MADLLFFISNQWQLNNMRSPKRALFENDDVLEFQPTSTTAVKLVVRENGNGDHVLASYIPLKWENGVLVGEAYGRKMTFRQFGSEKSIVYEANYLILTGDQPDEGGDGDPK
jgi:hypothetical protein